MALKIREMETYLQQQQSFTVADLQHKFQLNYGEARQFFRVLEGIGKIRLDSGVTFVWVAKMTETVGKPQLVQHEEYFDVDDEEDDIDDFDIDDLLLDDDDDDDVDEDDYDDSSKFLVDIPSDDSKFQYDRSLPQHLTCKIVDKFNYGDRGTRANCMGYTLYRCNIKMIVKAVQIGPAVTRYVYDFWQEDAKVDNPKAFVESARLALAKFNDVNLFAPYYGNLHRIAIDQSNEETLDPLCKKALLFFLIKNDGRASIAALQRNLQIGFNRSGRIVDSLQKLNCVETLGPDDPSVKPLRVTITKEQVEILFPQFLGWDD